LIIWQRLVNAGKKKTARTSQKEEEVGELPRATEVTGGRRSFLSFVFVRPVTKPLDKEVISQSY